MNPNAEKRAIVAATLGAAALIAQQVAGKATRDALFLTHFDVERLPAMMMMASGVSIVSVLAFSRALALKTPARLMPRALGVGTLLLLAQGALVTRLPQLAAVVFYVHMAAFGAPLISGFWSLVGERFDPLAAKRAMGRIGTGAAVGGVAGGLLAWGMSRIIPLNAMLALMAAFYGLCFVALLQLRGESTPVAEKEAPGAASELFSGVRILGESPYLVNLAIIVGLGAAGEKLLDFVMSVEVKARFSTGSELISFFALFHTGVAILSLLVQGTLARRSLSSLGLAATASIRPAVVAVTSVVGFFVPGLLTTVLARGSMGVIGNSLFRSAYELLYTPLPADSKRRTKALIDVGADKLGGVLGGGAAYMCVLLAADVSQRVVFLLTLLGALGALALARLVHSGYVSALADSLKSGVVHLQADGIVDSTTLLTMTNLSMVIDRKALLAEVDSAALVEAADGEDRAPLDPLLARIVRLRSEDVSLVRAELRSELRAELVPLVIPLLGRNEVFLDALRSLRRVAARVQGQLVDGLLDPEQPLAVRRRLPRVLKACPTERSVAGLMAGLRDEEFEVRYECAASIVRLIDRVPELRVGETRAFETARWEIDRWRAEGGGDESRDRRLEHVFTILSLGLDREALRLAHRALHSGGRMRGTAIEYLSNVLPDDLREGIGQLSGLAERGPTGPRRSTGEVKKELAKSVEETKAPRSLAHRRDDGDSSQ